MRTVVTSFKCHEIVWLFLVNLPFIFIHTEANIVVTFIIWIFRLINYAHFQWWVASVHYVISAWAWKVGGRVTGSGPSDLNTHALPGQSWDTSKHTERANNGFFLETLAFGDKLATWKGKFEPGCPKFDFSRDNSEYWFKVSENRMMVKKTRILKNHNYLWKMCHWA